MRAGLLKERINFLQPVIIKTDTGSEELDYVCDFSCRAEVLFQGGTKTNENGDVFYTRNVTFYIRRFYKFDQNYRIRWKDKTYSITYIEPHRELQRIAITAELINDFALK